MNSRLMLGLILLLLGTPAVAADKTQNGITIACPWAEATLIGAPIAPVYMEIRASPQAGDRLEGAAFTLADRVELYTYTRVAGVLRRQLIQYIAVEPGQSVQLQPGGFHLLLVGLKQPLVANTSFDMWVQFDDVGGFEISVDVVPIGASPPCGPARTGVPSGVMPSGVAPPIVAPPFIPPPFIPPPKGSF